MLDMRYTPTQANSARSFGGGFVQGTANDPRYNGSYIVARSVQMGQPVIVVGVKSVQFLPRRGKLADSVSTQLSRGVSANGCRSHRF